MRHRYRHPNTFSMRDCDRFAVIEQGNTFLRIAILYWRAGRRPTALRTLPRSTTGVPQMSGVVNRRHKSTLVEARFGRALGPLADATQCTEAMSMFQGKKTKSTPGLAIQSASA